MFLYKQNVRIARRNEDSGLGYGPLSFDSCLHCSKSWSTHISPSRDTENEFEFLVIVWEPKNKWRSSEASVWAGSQACFFCSNCLNIGKQDEAGIIGYDRNKSTNFKIKWNAQNLHSKCRIVYILPIDDYATPSVRLQILLVFCLQTELSIIWDLLGSIKLLLE